MRLTKTVNHGKIRWRVSTKLNGKRTQRFFSTRSHAREWMLSVQDNASIEDFWRFRNSTEKLQIVELFQLAETKGVRLKDLASSLVQYQKLVQIRLSEAVKIYICELSKRSLRPSSNKQSRINLNQLSEEFDGRDCHSITSSDLEHWFRERNWKRSTVDGVIAKIGPFFNWCIREKYSRENPVKGVIRPKEDESEPCILTPDEVFRILTVAQRHSPKLIPYLVLGLFGGVRPEEINRLQWQDISIHGITISGHKAKTRKRRLVSISANMTEWLKLGGELPPRNKRKQLDRVRKMADVTWGHDIMRHTFASYHLAYHGSPDRTAHELGHRDTNMLFRHYRQLVTKEEAEKFWAIRPEL